MAFVHKTKGFPPHAHDTVLQARQCEEEVLREEAFAQMEFEAEQAIERFYETNVDLAVETQNELAMEGAWG